MGSSAAISTQRSVDTVGANLTARDREASVESHAVLVDTTLVARAASS
jgi:hypothetical protein